MTNDRPSGPDDDQPGRPRPDWDADDPQAWDEGDAVRSGDAHSRRARSEAESWHAADEGEYAGDEHYDDEHYEHGEHYHHEPESYGYEAAGSDDPQGVMLLDESNPAGRAHRPLWRRLLVYALALAVLGAIGVSWWWRRRRA